MMSCVTLYSGFFVFFKQRTAYEMRISDWSSDVFSSDLALRREDAIIPARKEDMVELEALGGVDRHDGDLFPHRFLIGGRDQADMFEERLECFILLHQAGDLLQILQSSGGFDRAIGLEHRDIARFLHDEFGQLAGAELRSEEHTSELQSLMRISYAVFCLN